MVSAWAGEHVLGQLLAAAIDTWILACVLAAAVGILRWGFRGRK